MQRNADNISDQVHEFRLEHAKRHQDELLKEKKQALSEFLQELNQFASRLYRFKKDFYSIYANGLIEQVEELQHGFKKFTEQAENLNLAHDANISTDRLKKCDTLLSDLIENQIVLSQHCYNNFVIPLIDTFWNYKFSIEQSNGMYVNLKMPTVITPTLLDESNKDPVFKTYDFENAEPKTQSQLIKKYRGKEVACSLDRALRRAAAFGGTESVYDIHTLLDLGASIKSTSEDGKTALHWAIIYGNREAVHYLLQRNASLYISDNHNKQPIDYALESKDSYIRSLSANLHHYLHSITIFTLISEHVSKDIPSLRQVSVLLSRCVLEREDHLFKCLPIGSKEYFENMPKPLKKVAIKYMHSDLEKAKSLFEILLINTPADRQKLLEKYLKVTFSNNVGTSRGPYFFPIPYSYNGQSLFSFDSFIFHLVLKLTNEDDIIKDKQLLNPFYVYQLDAGLIVLNSFKTNNKIANVLTAVGTEALEEKLITCNEIESLKDVSGLLTKQGLTLLREKIITVELLIAISEKIPAFNTSPIVKYFDRLRLGCNPFSGLDPKNNSDVYIAVKFYQNLNVYLSPAYQDLIRETELPFKKIAYINGLDGKKIECLRQILNLKLIPLDSFSKIRDWSNLLTANGIRALTKGYITWEQAAGFGNLSGLLCDEGLEILKEGVITVKEAKEIEDICGSEILPNILKRRISTLIKLKCLTILDIKKMIVQNKYSAMEGIKLLGQKKMARLFFTGQITIYDIHSLVSGYSTHIVTLNSKFDLFVSAAKDKSFTLRDYLGIRDRTNFLTPSGILAFKTGLITLEEAKNFHSLALLNMKNGLVALEEGLISLNDADKFKNYNVSHLINNSLAAVLNNLGLLREKLITLEQANLFYQSNSCWGPFDTLKDLLNPLGITAIRKKLITYEKACKIPNIHKLFDPANPSIIEALELGAVSVDDFTYNQPYQQGITAAQTIKLIEEYKAANPHATPVVVSESENSISAPTSTNKPAPSSLGLFSRINDILKTGNVNITHIGKINHTLELIKNNNLTAAEEELSSLKLNIN